ncbi:cell cycle checkpoint protein RAD17-like [Anneissia japonica]|uniref:cell cycle checkpoint protein RAD17-like n=1 Tax=Anneissia japonica TaxID=1529436 RepID=UPI001425A016|nr:cell cycle checkpoint protein RAD17-like [Anneissia japonica]
MSDFGDFAGQRYQSQATLFCDFITRANKYQSLQLFGEKSFKKKVIVIEGSCQFQVPYTSTLKSFFDGSRKCDSTLARKSFKSTKSKNTKHKRMSKWRTKQTEDEKEGKDLVAIGGRNTSMFLFRALGKILYCKRVKPKIDADKQHIPPHLQRHDRDNLKFNPERVDDVVRGSEYLSDADLISSNFSHRSILSEYSSCIATRGLIHCNSSRSRHNTATSGMGWKPLHKPQWWQVAKQCRENTLSAKALFIGHCWTPVALHTQLLPYLSRIKSPLNNKGQISLLQ